MIPYSHHSFLYDIDPVFDCSIITKSLVPELSKQGYFGYLSISFIMNKKQ
jgi:hypothetical protein